MSQTVTSVGIDVSKNHSTVSFWQPGDKNVVRPHEVNHQKDALSALVKEIKSFGENTRVIMEYTGRYYQPIAEYLNNAQIYVSVVNPVLIKSFTTNKLHEPKTDKADSKKIGRYGLLYWNELTRYKKMDAIREQLKVLNRQFDFYTKQKTAMSNNLISLVDATFPGIEKQFSSPVRADGHQKWVDFVASFWHVDCVLDSGPSMFAKRYEQWCKRNGYRNAEDAEQIYVYAKKLFPTLPKDNTTKMIIESSVDALTEISRKIEAYRIQMNDLAAKLPEYEVVMNIYGVGPSLGPQLMAEIGDVTRFHSRGALTAFAGVDPMKRHDSGQVEQKSVSTTKRGSPYLRCTLFKVMDILLKNAPENDAVYNFMMKKRDEGKPYHVYMTAGANKFLRIYYGRVNEYLAMSADSANS